MKYEIILMLIFWSISGSNVELSLDRIRCDYIVRQTIILLLWKYYLERRETDTYLLYEFELDFELDFELTGLQVI